MTSLRGYYIILNEYNFDYERKARQLYLNIEEFNYISGEATVYSNDIQFINDIPSIQAFIAILNQEINEENVNIKFNFIFIINIIFTNLIIK